jgi:hypothetical protein
MPTVADVLRPECPRSWHEAVAIVQEIASKLAPGLGMPVPDDLYLDEAGGLSLGFGSEASGNPVSSLGGLLQALLEGIDAPDGLRELARENAGPAPAHASLDGFVRGLAFYERPNRPADLAAVASRLTRGDLTRAADAEFARLREKVAAKAEPRSEKEPDADPEKSKQKRDTTRRGLNQRQKAMLLAAAAALVLVAVAGFGRGRMPSRGAGLIDQAENRLAGVIASVLARFGMGTEAPPPLEAEAGTGAAAEAEAPDASGGGVEGDRPSADSASRAAAASKRGSRSAKPSPPDHVLPWTAPAAADAVPALLPDPGEGDAPVIELATAGPAMELPNLAPVDLGVFSSANADVKPPSFLRPQLPREPAPGEDTGYFDIVVSEQGDVEQVKLLSPAHRFQERMLVSAAKAWKFAPARLDGRPVKYRMRIPIILKGMP